MAPVSFSLYPETVSSTFSPKNSLLLGLEDLILRRVRGPDEDLLV